MSQEMATAIVAGGQRGSAALTVLYDERCPLCRKLKSWLATQATLVPIDFVAAGSATARRRFPGLDHDRTITVLTVVTQAGAVFEEERAWLMCAWTLPRWQPVAEHLGTPRRLPVVRLAARVIDGYRHRLLARTAAYGDGGEDCERCRIVA